MSPPVVLYAVTSSVTATAFLRGQLKSTAAVCRVGLVVGDEVPIELVTSEGVAGYSIGLGREPQPLADLRGLWRLIKLLRREHPGVVVFGTPKMSLLAACASWIRRVPRRVYVIHGLRWEGLTGWRRLALRQAERLTCSLATDVVAVSESVRRLAVSDLKVEPSRVRVIHHGSANGIDTDRFRPLRGEARQEARRRLGLLDDSVVFTFVGRLTYDKGIQQLPRVWRLISEEVADAQLVVVGESEVSGVADAAALDELDKLGAVTVLPHVRDVERLLGAADVNLTLTRREGMPTVVLEAASCEVPTVAYEVTGTVDAVAEQTGRLVALDALREFADAAIRLGNHEGERALAGAAARARVLRDFRAEDVRLAWLEFLTRDMG